MEFLVHTLVKECKVSELKQKLNNIKKEKHILNVIQDVPVSNGIIIRKRM